MIDGTIILLRPKLTFKTFFTLPVGTLIQLFTGGKVSHVGIYLDKSVAEMTFHNNFSITTREERFKQLLKLSNSQDIFIMTPYIALTESQLNKLRSFNKTQKNAIYGIGSAMFTVADRIPLLNKINWGRKRIACSIYVCSALQAIGIIKPEIDPFKINPNELVSLLKRSGFYGQEEKIIIN